MKVLNKKHPPSNTNLKEDVFMIVSVDNNLVDLKKFLIKNGIEVYNISDGVVSDAYIYSMKNNDILKFYNSIHGKGEGSLIINADGKSFQDILYFLNHRVYSSLF
ncbi:hypothetical protein FDN13_07755 [Caloramator sp. E03]|nr:hypothetical protein FDN13_07755 [Caloramator sp. E03]